MAYCAIADVEAMLHETYGAGTMPSHARVEDICDNVSAEIDGVLAAAGYTVPVTSAQALALLKSYAEKAAAAEAWHEGHTTDAALPKIEYWEKSYADFLARIRRGEQSLPGITVTADYVPAFGVAPAVPRDNYFTTEQTLDG